MSREPNPILRKISGTDREFLRRVFHSSWQRAFAAANLPAETRQQLLDHQFEAQDSSYHTTFPDADYDLILIDDIPAGRIYVDRGTSDISLMEMTLLPAHRNQGVGTTLIKQLLEEAREHRKTVSLHVEHWNPDARRLYERLGFRIEEDIGTHWKMRWKPD